jgi:hypothetical protein
MTSDDEVDDLSRDDSSRLLSEEEESLLLPLVLLGELE